jgi:hypothetical protein
MLGMEREGQCDLFDGDDKRFAMHGVLSGTHLTSFLLCGPSDHPISCLAGRSSSNRLCVSETWSFHGHLLQSLALARLEDVVPCIPSPNTSQ